jgi:hypothetical protein
MPNPPGFDGRDFFFGAPFLLRKKPGFPLQSGLHGPQGLQSNPRSNFAKAKLRPAFWLRQKDFRSIRDAWASRNPKGFDQPLARPTGFLIAKFGFAEFCPEKEVAPGFDTKGEKNYSL